MVSLKYKDLKSCRLSAYPDIYLNTEAKVSAIMFFLALM